MMPKRPEYAQAAPTAQRFRERLAQEQQRQRISDAGLARRVSALGLRMTAATVWKIKAGDPPRKVDLDEAHAIASALGYESASAMLGDDNGKRCRDLTAAVDRDMLRLTQPLRETGRALDEFASLSRSLPPVDRVRLSAEIADSIERASARVSRFADRHVHRLADGDVRRAMEGIERERRAEAARLAAEDAAREVERERWTSADWADYAAEFLED
jgi:hypothetical protein